LPSLLCLFLCLFLFFTSRVKSIVELHDGTVSVESEVGKGSKFTVSLPMFRVTNSTGSVSSVGMSPLESLKGGSPGPSPSPGSGHSATGSTVTPPVREDPTEAFIALQGRKVRIRDRHGGMECKE
jgi:hypothetical protein